MYLRVPGVPGSVSGGKYDGCFVVSSYQFGVGRGISSPGGGFRRRRGRNNRAQRDEEQEKKREMSDASVSEIVVSVDGWNANLAFFFGVQLSGYTFPTIDLLFSDNIITMKECIVSGFSLSVGRPSRKRNSSKDNDEKEEKKRPKTAEELMGSSVSFNFVSLVQRTTSVYRQPMSIPEGFLATTVTPQITTHFGLIGHHIFSFLDQKDLCSAANSCKIFLFSASHKSLLRQSTHEWAYDLGTAKTMVDGYALPKNPLCKSYDRDDNDDNEGEAAEGSNEKQAEKKREEAEQQQIKEELKKAPFAVLFENF